MFEVIEMCMSGIIKKDEYFATKLPLKKNLQGLHSKMSNTVTPL